MINNTDRLLLAIFFILAGNLGLLIDSEIVCSILIIIGVVLLILPYALNKKMKGGNHGNKRKFKK